MDDFYLIGLVLCSVASVALLFARRYVKSELLWVLRLSAGIGFVVFAIFNAIHSHERELQIAARQQQIADVQLRLDNIKLRQTSLKARADALATEEAKGWADPNVQKHLAASRIEVLRENAAIKSELDGIQKELKK
jgi:hypothetical protein